MNAVRIRTQLESTTITAPELAAFLGRRVEIIVIDDEPASRTLLTTRGMFAASDEIAGDPLADVLAELRAERARRMAATAEEVAE